MTLDAKSSPLQAARELSRLAKLSYTPNDPSEYPFDRTISVGENQARVFANKTIGVVAVTGTKDRTDWAVNLDSAVYMLNDRVGLHTGFYKGATSILAAVHSIENLPDCFRDGRWWCCGHSMGAAVASILTLLAAEEDRIGNPVGCVGFGCPRYVMGDSALLFPIPILSISDTNDPVSHVPMKLCRAGMQVYISEDGFTCHSGSEVKRLAGYVFRALRLRWLAGKTSVANHSMARYELLVNRALDKLDR